VPLSISTRIAPTEIYTLSLHDALPISYATELLQQVVDMNNGQYLHEDIVNSKKTDFCIGVAGYPEKHFESPNFNTDFRWLKKKRSEEHTSELQSRENLVCRLLLEKKKK